MSSEVLLSALYTCRMFVIILSNKGIQKTLKTCFYQLRTHNKFEMDTF